VTAPADPEPFRVGQQVGGELSDNTALDEDGAPYADWVLETEAGARYRVDLWSNDFDTYLRAGRLNGSSFMETSSNDDASSNDLGPNDSRLTVRGDGRPIVFRVKAYDSDERGQYALEATRIANPRPDPIVSELSLGSSASGEITDTDAVLPSGISYREYRINIAADQRVEVTLSSDDFDSWVAVGLTSGPAMSELFTNDDGGENLDARLVFIAPRAGEYTIRVRPYGEGETGRYTVRARQLPPARTSPVTEPIAFGATVNSILADDDAVLTTGQSYREYRFTAREGQRIQITLDSSDFDATLGVGLGSGPGMGEIFRNDDAGNGTDARLAFVAPVDGDYTIRVYSYSEGESGRFRLSLMELPPAPTSRRLEVGVSVTDLITDIDPRNEDNTPYHEWTFQANRGESFLIDLSSDDFDAMLEVGTLSGGYFSVLDENDDSVGLDSRIIFTAPDTGEYVVRARSYYDSARGTYTLTLRRRF
jgi:hypothetical protein